LYLPANLESRGIAALQGVHQVAQNSTTYTVPFSNWPTGLPFNHSRTRSDGAGSPRFSVGGCSFRPFTEDVIITNRNNNNRKFDRIIIVRLMAKNQN
jgi:hypothetical protein